VRAVLAPATLAAACSRLWRCALSALRRWVQWLKSERPLLKRWPLLRRWRLLKPWWIRRRRWRLYSGLVLLWCFMLAHRERHGRVVEVHPPRWYWRDDGQNQRQNHA
jgi:hypothetical protein